MRWLRDKRAFSLLEMMTVLVIIAPISIGLTVIFADTVSRKNLQVEAERMVGELTWARHMALAQRQNYVVTFDTGGESLSIYRGSISPSNLQRTFNFGVDLYIAPGSLSFNYPKGNASSDSTIFLRRNTRQVSVTVSADTGFVRMN